MCVCVFSYSYDHLICIVYVWFGLPERGEEEKPGVEIVRSKFEEFSGNIAIN